MGQLLPATGSDGFPKACWTLRGGSVLRRKFLHLFLFPIFDKFLSQDQYRDRVSLCSPGCTGTGSTDQAGLEFGDMPASASRVLDRHCLALMVSFITNLTSLESHGKGVPMLAVSRSGGPMGGDP